MDAPGEFGRQRQRDVEIVRWGGNGGIVKARFDLKGSINKNNSPSFILVLIIMNSFFSSSLYPTGTRYFLHISDIPLAFFFQIPNPKPQTPVHPSLVPLSHHQNRETTTPCISH
jgi:hypothetical protein